MGPFVLVLAAAVATSPAPPSSPAPPASGPAYVRAIDEWRAKREEGLRAPDGWLSVVGLHWLHEGSSTLGSAKGNDVVLPLPAPARVGTIEVAKGRTVIHADAGATVEAAGKRITELELHSDKNGKPDVLAVGAVGMYV
ncbi:MAG TPA: DUF1684 domain-containing protein, partial [Vicinamibacteria bacterium]|nr:DUF1684 domain-containing protein [Vicinamibacteria bacterium]